MPGEARGALTAELEPGDVEWRPEREQAVPGTKTIGAVPQRTRAMPGRGSYGAVPQRNRVISGVENYGEVPQGAPGVTRDKKINIQEQAGKRQPSNVTSRRQRHKSDSKSKAKSQG